MEYIIVESVTDFSLQADIIGRENLAQYVTFDIGGINGYAD